MELYEANNGKYILDLDTICMCTTAVPDMPMDLRLRLLDEAKRFKDIYRYFMIAFYTFSSDESDFLGATHLAINEIAMRDLEELGCINNNTIFEAIKTFRAHFNSVRFNMGELLSFVMNRLTKIDYLLALLANKHPAFDEIYQSIDPRITTMFAGSGIGCYGLPQAINMLKYAAATNRGSTCKRYKHIFQTFHSILNTINTSTKFLHKKDVNDTIINYYLRFYKHVLVGSTTLYKFITYSLENKWYTGDKQTINRYIVFVITLYMQNEPNVLSDDELAYLRAHYDIIIDIDNSSSSI